MTRQAVSSDQGPGARSLQPGHRAGGFVFCSGTVGIDPETGEPAVGIEAHRLRLRNLAAILDVAGTSMANLVKTTIFYAEVGDFAS